MEEFGMLKNGDEREDQIQDDKSEKIRKEQNKS